MKSNLRLSKSLFALLGLCVSSSAGAATTIFFTSAGTGASLDEEQLSGLPVTTGVVEISGLDITVTGSASVLDGSDLNSTTSSLGINSAESGDATAGFDSDFSESIGISFSQDVNIVDVDLAVFTGAEVFNFGDFAIMTGDVDGSNIFTFPDGGLFLAAGTAVNLSAGVGAGGESSSIGLISISLNVVPEPSSSALLCLSGLGLCLFRRRS